jgi:hypothetical protein
MSTALNPVNPFSSSSSATTTTPASTIAPHEPAPSPTTPPSTSNVNPELAAWAKELSLEEILPKLHDLGVETKEELLLLEDSHISTFAY